MPAPVPTSGKDPAQKTVMRVYGAFVASLFLMFVPSLSFALVSLVFFLGVLVSAYIVRSNAEADSLTENHMIFIIRTIWIVSFFAIVTVTAGGAYLWTQADLSAVEACAQPINNYVMANAEAVKAIEIFALFSPCQQEVIEDNRFPLMMASALAIIPLMLYLILRLTRGIGRASKGYRIARPKAWF